MRNFLYKYRFSVCISAPPESPPPSSEIPENPVAYPATDARLDIAIDFIDFWKGT
jgi:hypothetical protein